MKKPSRRSRLSLPGMELSLFSRDVIALSTAVALSHEAFDAALLFALLPVWKLVWPVLNPLRRSSLGRGRVGRAPVLRAGGAVVGCHVVLPRG